MLCGKCNNNLIMKTQYIDVHELFIIHKQRCIVTYLNGKIDIHTQNIQILMTEIYKCLNKISPPFTGNTIIKKVIIAT